VENIDSTRNREVSHSDLAAPAALSPAEEAALIDAVPLIQVTLPAKSASAYQHWYSVLSIRASGCLKWMLCEEALVIATGMAWSSRMSMSTDSSRTHG
jgi:hypothetical protein